MSGSMDGSPRKLAPASGHLSRFSSMPWSQTDMTSSASLARASTPPAFDTQGKLNRRVWVLENQLKDVEGSIDAERAINHDLRERISVLQKQVKDAEARVRDAEERERQVRRDMEGEMAAKASQQSGLAAQLEDVKDSWRREKAERVRLEGEVDRLKAARIEAGAVPFSATAGGSDSAALQRSPRKVLQPQSANIDRTSILTTPTKPHHPAAARQAGDPLSPTPHRSPSKSLAAYCAHVEAQHRSLKAEYARLKAVHAEDVRHWKEYRAAEIARIDAKKQRRATRKEARGTSGRTSSAEDKERLALPAVSIDQPAAGPTTHLDPSQRLAEPEIAVDAPAKALDIQSSSQPRSSQISEEGMYDEEEAAVILPGRRSSQRIKSQSQRTPKATSPVKPRTSAKKENTTPALATPTAGPSSRARIPTAGRTTPWLGTDPSPGKTTPVTRSKRKARVDYDDEDVFGDADESLDTPHAAVRIPLVRDRGAGANTSLRTSTLRKTVPKQEIAPASDDPESGRKRKLTDLEHASPAEKAAELKRLSKMTSKQRREYYAGYKGSGRYMAPDEVRYGVYEDYEIDPAENEGEKYQFHDVKRQRTQRKQMHGGDCECCQAYYEAIGPIPRFNQAPKWKDGPEEQGTTSKDAEMREHQNQVSRHRETWRRPPTPPGYWEIGFPGTQLVQEQNEMADQMMRKKEAEIHREAMHKDSKWRKKKGAQGEA